MTTIPLNEHTRYILGRSSFTLVGMAEALRRGGMHINRRAEDEQATCICWMLNMYLIHGDDWKAVAAKTLNEMQP